MKPGDQVVIQKPHYEAGQYGVLVDVWQEDRLPIGWTAGPQGEVRLHGDRPTSPGRWRSKTGVQRGGRYGWVSLDQLAPLD